ncbi:MAG: multiprotein-bridging factor 1 family protein [Candidatus Micrarchaeaceae archaeon]
MYDCDICGRPAETVYIVEIEGAKMMLCGRCAKGKAPLQVVGPEKGSEPGSRAVNKLQLEEPELVADYGSRIKSARNSLGISTKVLAERINEKESTLIRVEGQRMLPNEKLRKKLERELGIKLVSEPEAAGGRFKGGGGDPGGVSLWDAAVKKEKKR